MTAVMSCIKSSLISQCWMQWQLTTLLNLIRYIAISGVCNMWLMHAVICMYTHQSNQ